MTWHVMHGSADYDQPYAKPVTEPPAHDNSVYTISERPRKAGWCTDGGHSHYGLTYAKARYICDVLNAHEAKEAEP